VTLESTGGWKKQELTMVKGNKTLVATDKCLTRTPNIRVTLENLYEMVCESRFMFGAKYGD
jgi:hypothetical protein